MGREGPGIFQTKRKKQQQHKHASKSKTNIQVKHPLIYFLFCFPGLCIRMLDAHLRQFLETSDSSKQNIFPLFHHILYRHDTKQQLKIQIYVTNFFF